MTDLTKSISDVAHRLGTLITDHRKLLNRTTKQALKDVESGGLNDATVNSIYKDWTEQFARELLEFRYP